MVLTKFELAPTLSSMAARLSSFDRMALERRIVELHLHSDQQVVQIAATLQISEQFVKRVLKKHKDRIETHYAARNAALTKSEIGILVEQREEIFNVLPKAVRTAINRMSSRDQRVSLDAAKTLMDRAGLTAAQTERILNGELTGPKSSQPEVNNETVNILMLAIEKLQTAPPQLTLPPMPPALRSLQEGSDIIDIEPKTNSEPEKAAECPLPASVSVRT